MACLCSKTPYLVVVLWVLTLRTSLSLTSAQSSNTTSCVTDLIPCASYINTTGTPPFSCCDPIKKAVTTELTCLCTLYETPGLLVSFGVNVTQALLLTQRCSVPVDINACFKPAEAPNAVPTPPAVPRNDGSRIPMIEFSSLIILLASLLMHWTDLLH